jgi:hypothetical protein
VLPFVQAPAPAKKRRIGNDACGVLEIEERGGLTVNESNTITELLDAQQSSLASAAKLADAIATEQSISITEAFKIIEDSIAGAKLEDAADTIRLRYAERIQQIHTYLKQGQQRTAEATVTALIRHRLAQRDWDLDDTRKLDQALFDGIWLLALDEQEAENMPSNPPTEAELKKPQPEATAKPKRTGTKSSGN